MKSKVILPLMLAALLAGYTAYAVSIEFVVLNAVEISDLQFYTVDGETKEVSVEFSGPDLKLLMNLLPEVRNLETENNDVIEHIRWIDIRGDETNGKVSNITLHCETKEYNEKQELVNVKNEVKCSLSISKGAIAG